MKLSSLMCCNQMKDGFKIIIGSFNEIVITDVLQQQKKMKKLYLICFNEIVITDVLQH